MEINFIGTGTSQGVPVIACNCDVCHSTNPLDKRLRSSVLISHEGKNIVIDSGPDFRQQMLRAKVESLDAILYTHEHKDHIAGLDDIRAYNHLTRQPMDLYAEERVLHAIRREFAYAFAPIKYPGIPQMELHSIQSLESISVAGISVLPVRTLHYKLPILAFRIFDFAYITDTNYIGPLEMEQLKGLDVLVVNALRKEKHLSHFNLSEAIDLITYLKPRRAYLTHISHLMGLHNAVSMELPPTIEIAYDGLVVTT